jgi:endoglucanase
MERKITGLMFLALMLSALVSYGQTVVSRHGQLSVSGRNIKDQCGRNAQLKGPSYFWSNWEGSEFFNANAVGWLASDWKAEVVRAAMGVRYGAGDCCDYYGDPTGSKNKVKAVVDGAIQHGIYVIIDWHSHGMHTADAKAFFIEMAQLYGSYPNVIYEIYNEPTGSSWDNLDQTWPQLKTYSRELIAAIRQYDPDNLIICPTPFYDQFVHQAADDPITVDINNNPVSNIAYTLHVYADAHRFDGQVGTSAKYALSKNLPMFVTESGATGTVYNQPRSTGINAPNYTEWAKWEEWWDTNGIGYTKWSLSTKDEFGSSLLPGAPATGGWNYNTHLTDEGRWNRDHFRAVNTLPAACSTDEVVSVTSPTSVTRGQNATVTVNYSATTNRDVHVVFQSDTSPWTTYASVKLDVTAGTRSVNVTVPIPSTVPLANDAYKFQTFITTDGGGWAQRLDNLEKIDVDCIDPTGSIVIRARGYGGGEIMKLRVDDVDVATYTMTTAYQNFTYNNYSGSHNIKVAFTNDGANKDLIVDYITVCGTTYQTSAATRTGCGSATWLWCNGNFNYGTIGCSATGGRLGTETVSSEEKTTSVVVYPNPVTEGGSVKIETSEEKLGKVEVYDLQGRIIFEQKEVRAKSISIPASIFKSNGLYLARTHNGIRPQIIKIIVKK